MRKTGDRPGGFERRELRPDHVKPRRTHFEFPPSIPRYWAAGSPARTHVLNSLHLFLPSFERMVLRTVLDGAVPRLTDPALIAQACGLAGQEASHSRAHELFLDSLRAQGYRIEGFLRFTRWLFEDLLEKRLGPRLSLSVVAGFEHYTDLLVSLVLDGDFLDGCEPHMRELLEWHAAEEVEHDSVADDLLRAIDDGYALRMFGNVVGLLVILGFVVAGAGLLLGQDRKLLDRATGRELWGLFFTKYGLAREVVRLFVVYTRPSHRPHNSAHLALARPVLAPAGTG